MHDTELLDSNILVDNRVLVIAEMVVVTLCKHWMCVHAAIYRASATGRR